jgi:flavin reductase (DIM6/NTAB) family NADH-FMN oxidoreductase RutF
MRINGTRFRGALKRVLFGSASFSQFRAIGLRDPQSEVGVWLHGLGAPRDVTYNHVAAAAKPFTIGVGLEDNLVGAGIRRGLSVRFQERRGEKRLLGSINLRLIEAIPLGDRQLYLFEPQSYRNHSIARAWLWMRYFYYAYERRRQLSEAPQAPTVARDLHRVFVFYLCPRPVVLASATEDNAGNIFPLDLIGSLGAGRFSLALQNSSTAAPLLERSRRVALSSVPVEQTSVAYKLGKNHRESQVNWDQLPFATTPSPVFGIPVPCFSLRVREMQIESVRPMGSYKFFLGRIVKDTLCGDGPQFFLVHGFLRPESGAVTSESDAAAPAEQQRHRRRRAS